MKKRERDSVSYPSHQLSPLIQDVNWRYIRRSEVSNVFWTLYVRSIYVLCLRGIFANKLRHRCLTGLWIRLWYFIGFTNFFFLLNQFLDLHVLGQRCRCKVVESSPVSLSALLTSAHDYGYEYHQCASIACLWCMPMPFLEILDMLLTFERKKFIMFFYGIWFILLLRLLLLVIRKNSFSRFQPS